MILILVLVVVVILIILLLILLKTTEHLTYNLNNEDFIISLFLTGGLCEEAENCIKSIENVGLKKKLIVTTLDNTAFECINKLNVKVENKKTNLEKEANFGTKQFYDIMIYKIKIVYDLLKKNKKTVVYSDSDIVFLKNISNDVNNFTNSNNDIMIQDDSSNFNNSNNLCAGFMFLKPTETTFKVLNKVLFLLNKYKNDINKLKQGGGADQRALNIAIKDIKPNIKILDLKDYPNGARYFNNIDTIYKDYKPKIIHNNYIVGTQNKINRFKKYNLWFINNDSKFSKPKLYGTQYGGFYLPINLSKDIFKKSKIIYYGIGVGEDISFDIIMGNKLGAEIVLVDPTPRAKLHYDKIIKSFSTNKYEKHKNEGGGDSNYQIIIKNNKIEPKQILFENTGIGIINSTQKFYMNKNPNNVSGSFDSNMNFVNKNNYINVHIKTIDTIMAKYNHSTIDILKLDIEGLEIEVLNYILDKNILPKIICVDFDSVREGKRKNEFELLKKRLKGKNYYLYHNDNLDITFIRN